MSDNVIKEFLVSLGFKTDGADKMEGTITGIQARAVALGEAMYDTARSVLTAVANMATGFDQLYWQTQRLGSSAVDIRAYGYALSQLGGSAAGAQSSLENIAEFMRSTPGSAGWLRGLGVTEKDFGNAQAVARDLAHAFQRMPYAQAKQYAAVIGIDPLTLQAMDRDTGKYEERYKAFAKSLGLNLDEVAGKSNKFMTDLREMKAEFGLMFDYAGYKVLEFILPKLERLAAWVRDMVSGKKLGGLSEEFRTLITDIGKLIEAIAHLGESNGAQRFAAGMVWALDNVIRMATQFAKVIEDLINRQWHQAWVDATTDVTRPLSDIQNEDSAPGGAASGPSTGRRRSAFGVPSQDDIDRIAPSAASGGGRGRSVSDGSNYIESYLTRAGMTAEQARGIRAGITAEGGSATAVNPTSGAFGIGQWLGPRKKRLFELYGPHPNIVQQLAFLVSELRGGDPGGKSVLAQGSAAGTMVAYLRDFMRPGQGLSGDLKRGYAALGMPQATLGTSGRGNVTINQRTEIHANGGNSRDVANDVAGQQDAVNQRLVATAGVFAY